MTLEVQRSLHRGIDCGATEALRYQGKALKEVSPSLLLFSQSPTYYPLAGVILLDSSSLEEPPRAGKSHLVLTVA